MVFGAVSMVRKESIIMIMIPKHVKDMAEKTKIEIQRQLEEYPLTEISLKHNLKAINDIQCELSNQIGKSFIDEDDYINSMKIMEDIMELSEGLLGNAIDRIYTDIEIQPELSFALNYARAIHPKMRKELDAVIQFLEEVPKSYWGQKDSCDDFKVFRLVKTKNKWEKIIREYSGEDLGINLRNMPDFKYIKIGYVSSETCIYNLTDIAESAREHLIMKLGEEGFERKRRAFERWFRIGKTGTYYIYVPK